MSAVASPPPIDLAQLARYTGGEPQLDAEVLELFRGQCAAIVERLETQPGGPDAKLWYATAHTLKGAAAAVGAGALANLASQVEQLDPSATPLEAEEAVRALKAHALLVAAFIESHLTR